MLLFSFLHNVDMSQTGFIKCTAGIITMGRLPLPTSSAVDSEGTRLHKCPPPPHATDGTTELSSAAQPSFSLHSAANLNHGFCIPTKTSAVFYPKYFYHYRQGIKEVLLESETWACQSAPNSSKMISPS